MGIPAFHSLKAEADIYFVRHGESAANTRKEMQGCRIDTPLSEHGLRQAATLGAWFSGRGITRVFTSSLKRAVETAQTVCSEAHFPEPEILPDLIEFDVGIFGGLTLEQIEQTFPEYWKEFRRQSWEAVPESEKIESLTARADRVWERIIEELNAGHRKLLCVTHGGLIQWIVKATLSDDPKTWMPVFKVSNCGIFHIRVEPTSADTGAGYYGMWNRMNFIVD